MFYRGLKCWLCLTKWYKIVVFQYLTELGCPYKQTNKREVLDWVLGYAIRLEYGDEGKFKEKKFSHVR